jgi:hypothetical protein
LISIQIECTQMDAEVETLMLTSEYLQMDSCKMEWMLLILITMVSYIIRNGLLDLIQYTLNPHGRPMMFLTTHSEHISPVNLQLQELIIQVILLQRLLWQQMLLTKQVIFFHFFIFNYSIISFYICNNSCIRFFKIMVYLNINLC